MFQMETIMILHENLTEKQFYSILDDYKEIISYLFKTHEIKIEVLGKKELAYPIKSCKDGWYALFTYNIHPSEESYIHELERKLRTDEQVLKFLTTKRSTEEDFEDLYKIDEDTYSTPAAHVKKESEQPDNKNIDALDVLLGLASYIKKGA